MKKFNFVIIILLIAMGFSLSGCGKVAEKAAEKAMEKVMEQATGGKVDLSKDGGKLEIDGQTVSFGEDLSWPKDSMGDLPQPKGKVTAVMSQSDGTVVVISEFEDGKGYVEKLKSMGYEDLMSMQDATTLIYVGKKGLSSEKSATVQVTYDFEGKEGSITYMIE
jgi:hypothetical protein